MPRWSKLQKRLYDLIAPGLPFQIHCVPYRMKSQRGSMDIPRYWITLGKEIIWDYPRDFDTAAVRASGYPYATQIGAISRLIRTYTDSPTEGLLAKRFDGDEWRLTDILKAADRRFGRAALRSLPASTSSEPARKILLKAARSVPTRTRPVPRPHRSPAAARRRPLPAPRRWRGR